MTTAEIERLRAEHVRFDGAVYTDCNRCASGVWPCDIARLLDHLDAGAEESWRGGIGAVRTGRILRTDAERGGVVMPRPVPRRRPNPRLSNPMGPRADWIDRLTSVLLTIAAVVWGAAITLWIWAHTCGMGVAC